MADLIKAIILGIIEGFTEFLPISSTAHLLIASQLLQFNPAMGATFEIFIQLGAILAVIGYFARDLWGQVRTVTHDKSVQRLWVNVIIAFIPAGAVGFLLHDRIKEVMTHPALIIAAALIVGGIIMIVVEQWIKTRSPRTNAAKDLSWGQALAVGIAQILALIPGTSRSGSTIVGGMLAGVSRAAATKFTFYLAIPTMLIATLYDLFKFATTGGGLTTNDVILLLAGLVAALIAAWISIGWLLRYVANHTLVPFGVYRIIVGVLILVLVFQGMLS